MEESTCELYSGTAKVSKLNYKSIGKKLNYSTEKLNLENPRGIVPVWRARKITSYQPELLPPEPVPLQIKDSLDSLIDIIDYLQQQYAVGDAVEGTGDVKPERKEDEEVPKNVN